jgi:exopolyphosphatase / guanosine-5'-triphosphate,3'-diphosphate pyrophosphatase
LQPHALRRTVRATVEFIAKARSYGVQSPRLIATSAARDAVNQGELLVAIEQEAGCKVEVLSGEQEAEMAYLGVTTDPAFAGQRLLIMDAGGGSTQFILGQGDHRLFQQSFPVGAVRLLEKFKPGDPPGPDELQRCRDWLRGFINQKVHVVLDPLLADGRLRTGLVGTGGTAAILARMEMAFDDYDRQRIEAVRLSAPATSRWVERLWSLPLAERKRTIGLPENRADVILMGAAIYEAVLLQFRFAELRISTRGLRFAAVLQPGPERSSPA